MKSVNYKNQYTLLVYLILSEHSDAEHAIEQNEIIDYLKDEYRVVTQRRSISRALDVLECLGFDLIRNRKGVALGGRVFDEGQLEYVLDAVYSSSSIPPKEADRIFEQLTKTLSLEERKRLAGIEKEEARGSLADPHVFYTIGAIADAIATKSLIRFTYNGYDIKGRLIPLMGYPRLVYPLKTFFRDGHYCLLAVVPGHLPLLRFYIERMSALTEEACDSAPSDAAMAIAVKDFLDKHPHLGAGTVISAELSFSDERVLNSLFPYFGTTVTVSQNSDGTFRAAVRADEESILSWCFAMAGTVKLVAPKESVDKLSQRLLDLIKAGTGNLLSNPTDSVRVFDSKTDTKFLTISQSQTRLLPETNFSRLLKDQVLCVGDPEQLFRLPSTKVMEMADVLLMEDGHRHVMDFGPLVLRELAEKENPVTQEKILLGLDPIPGWVIQGEQSFLLGLLLLWRLAYWGYEKSQGIDDELTKFFIDKFESYWPFELASESHYQTFSLEAAAREAFPLLDKENPTDWDLAVGAVDWEFQSLEAAEVKKILERLEKIGKFSSVAVYSK